METETENIPESTTLPTALPWGLRDVVPPEARIAWGARAIYKIHHDHGEYRVRGRDAQGRKRPALCVRRPSTTVEIGLMWDRQGTGCVGDVTERERKALARWLNTKGLTALRKACVKQYVTGDTMIVIERDGYTIAASPRCSYGYLYISAWKVN